MDLLYVYDDKIACDRDGNYYTGSAFSQEIFDRYLAQFDTLTLLMRRAPVSPDDMQTLARMNRLTDARIRVVFYPDRRESLRAFLSLQRRREIRQIITRSITPERAVIIRVPSESGTIAARFCRRIGKPFLAEAVGCPWDSLTHHSLRGKVLAPDAWLRMRWCMRHAPYAVYVTNAFLQRRYPTRGISAAVSDVELAPADAAVLARRLEKIRTHSGKLVLGTAAAVNVAFKGQRYVIEALALARLKKRKKPCAPWALAVFMSPTPVQAKPAQVPYFPYLLCVVDTGSGKVLTLTPPRKIDEYAPHFSADFLPLLQQHGLPREFWSADDRTTAFITPIAKQLGIPVNVQADMTPMDELLDELYDHLNDASFEGADEMGNAPDDAEVLQLLAAHIADAPETLRAIPDYMLTEIRAAIAALPNSRDALRALDEEIKRRRLPPHQ